MPVNSSKDPQNLILHRKLDQNLKEAQRLCDALEHHLSELRSEAELAYLRAIKKRLRNKSQ